jgi:hypothetical protein
MDPRRPDRHDDDAQRPSRQRAAGSSLDRGPIGLGIYFAWVDRDWSARIEITGFAAAVIGALIGARLGFNASEGPPAVLTTIVGAAAVGNLALLALDIVWDWQVRDRFAAKRTDTLEPSPSIG